MNCFSGENLICVRGNKCIFSELSFSVSSGEALILKGANGTGKSSLLRLMTGILTPKKGKIKWNNENILESKDEHNARFHFVGHLNPIKPTLTVYENIFFWSHLQPKPKKINYALEIFGISHLRNVSAQFLSAGQIRLTNLAKIVATPADIWLLDEPTSSLDKYALKKLDQILKDHQRDGGIVVASTHTNINIKNVKELELSSFSPTEFIL